MRTLVTLSVLLSLSLVAFVATAAPPTPQLVPDCGTACTTGNHILTAWGVNAKKSYGVTGYLNGVLDFQDIMTDNGDGTFSLCRDFDSGDWSFVLSVLGHAADPLNPQKDILTIDVTVQ